MTDHTSQQRTAIVTGAARGIGAAVAKRLARDGLAVGVIDLDEADCAATVEAITADGGSAALPLGTLLLAVGVRSGMVANQVRIHALRPEVLADSSPPT